MLARAHARGGQAHRIVGYLGKSDSFDRAMARFAVTYADTMQADHAQLSSAIANGTLEAVVEPGPRDCRNRVGSEAWAVRWAGGRRSPKGFSSDSHELARLR